MGRTDGRPPIVPCSSVQKEIVMGETATKLPIKQDISTPSGRRGPSLWQPFESLREEVDHIFEEFTRGLGRWPLDRRVFEVKPWSRYESAIRMAPA